MGLAPRDGCQSHRRIPDGPIGWARDAGTGLGSHHKYYYGTRFEGQNAPTDDLREGRSEAAFVASMHGLRGLTLEAARELDPYGIRVYAVENRGDKIVEDVFALLQLNGA